MIIPYNVFVDQVNAGNVVNITATGDSITGTAKNAVSAGPGQPSAKDFSTQRPSFASDNLEAALLKNNVSILAEPPNPPTPSGKRSSSGSDRRCCSSSGSST